jgi:hypothetical protein
MLCPVDQRQWLRQRRAKLDLVPFKPVRKTHPAQSACVVNTSVFHTYYGTTAKPPPALGQRRGGSPECA